MPCHYPITGYRSRSKNENGKRPIVFDVKKGYEDMKVELPCGKCMACRLEHSRQWAIRCVHESQLYDENVFLTLTYSPENLPEDYSLDKKHFVDFMKRLRNYFSVSVKNPETNRYRREYTRQLRYLMCGEYGEKLDRPHYHACVFNCDFPDKQLYKIENGCRLYTSEILNKIWGKGYCIIGDVTFESAAYVARYITKKVTGKKSGEHYLRVCQQTGEAFFLQPEYGTMSRGNKQTGGLGKRWLDKYKTDVYPKDYLTLRGIKMRPPNYYDKILEDTEEQLYNRLKNQRKKQSEIKKGDNTTPRLIVKEKVMKSRIKNLKRPIEEN